MLERRGQSGAKEDKGNGRTVPEVLYAGKSPGEEIGALLDPWWGRGEAFDVMRPGERPGVVCLAAFGRPLFRPCQIGLGRGALAGDGLHWWYGFSVNCQNGGGRG